MQDVDAPGPRDHVGELLAGLADRLRSELVGSATLERREFLHLDGVSWELHPVNRRSVPVSWLVFGGQIQLQTGRLDRGGCWELDRTAADVAFVEQVVDAAIAGRVTETSAPARSRVDVTLGDGRVVHETGYEGCRAILVPLPGWRRWGSVTRFEPYAGA